MPHKSEAALPDDQRASLSRRTDARDRTRAALLEAAASLLLEQGYAGFSMRGVGARAGFTATTIYRYFRDKDELVFAVTDEGFRAFARELERAGRSASDPFLRLRAIGRAYVGHALANPVLYRLMFVQRPDYLTAVPAGSDESRLESFGALRDAVAACVATRRTTTTLVELTSLTIWAGLHGIASTGLTIGWIEADVVEGMVEQLLDFVDAGLRKR